MSSIDFRNAAIDAARAEGRAEAERAHAATWLEVLKGLQELRLDYLARHREAAIELMDVMRSDQIVDQVYESMMPMFSQQLGPLLGVEPNNAKDD